MDIDDNFINQAGV